MNTFGMKKVSVLVTVFNEEQTIMQLLDGLVSQTHIPQEVILVDAQSTDKTVLVARNFAENNPELNLKIYSRAGNRSLGRNFGVDQARYEWIAITDAGCIPHPDWLEELFKRQQESEAHVIAGYYDALPSTAFEEAVAPYVLVMPDKIDEASFLPATRSMLITKTIWRQMGGLDGSLQLSEDYEFAHRLKEAGVSIAFAKRAKVSWLPRRNIPEFYQMVSGMAAGDVQAGVTRPKVYLVFARYIVLLSILSAVLYAKSALWLFLLIVGGFLYCSWAIVKSKKYVPRGWYWLPILQITADLGVMYGTVKALLKKVQYT